MHHQLRVARLLSFWQNSLRFSQISFIFFQTSLRIAWNSLKVVLVIPELPDFKVFGIFAWVFRFLEFIFLEFFLMAKKAWCSSCELWFSTGILSVILYVSSLKKESKSCKKSCKSGFSTNLITHIDKRNVKMRIVSFSSAVRCRIWYSTYIQN